MTWQQVRSNFPQQWLLIEAIKAHTETNQRLLDQISVIEPFEDSAIAWSRYAELHRESPEKEFYVIHTSREEPSITERRWIGLRR